MLQHTEPILTTHLKLKISLFHYLILFESTINKALSAYYFCLYLYQLSCINLLLFYSKMFTLPNIGKTKKIPTTFI